MSNTKIAFIGAGGLANNVHYPSIDLMDDVDLVGIAELNEERLQKTADKYEVEGRYSDYTKMIDEAEPDAVYIIMPPMYLHDLVVGCLERGRHVFVEKPPGMTAYQTATWARLAEEKELLTMCGFNRRHIPCLKAAKERIEAKGPINQCRSTFIKNGNAAGYYNGAIDILTCDAIHAVDSLRWLGGEVVSLASDIGHFESEAANAFNVLMKFDTGAVGFLNTNWRAGGRVHSWEIHGSGISAFVDPDHEGARIHEDNKLNADLIKPSENDDDPSYLWFGFYHEDRHFVDCVKSGETPITHFGDAAKTMELVERIYDGQI
ncbi:MAG: Gfo/Idh/MocA family oxidoreductase [Planctomycetota bacterium]|jgi:predicted dehydrogenase|nr:Gfo/Idh/MocA family oxidoreductase [Planctomycetota bacterium]MDP7249076.1 Gfo/Idh/MocA family oxidoreductase [Planctomycetota bacterium]